MEGSDAKDEYILQMEAIATELSSPIAMASIYACNIVQCITTTGCCGSGNFILLSLARLPSRGRWLANGLRPPIW